MNKVNSWITKTASSWFLSVTFFIHSLIFNFFLGMKSLGLGLGVGLKSLVRFSYRILFQQND